MTRGRVRDGSTTEDGVRVGVLSFHSSKETKAILNAVSALGHTPVWLDESTVRFTIRDGDIDLVPDVDVVANRLLATKAARPLDDLGTVETYAATRTVLNPVPAAMAAIHKYGAAARLAAAGVRVPDAYVAFDHSTLNDPDRPLDGRVVHKPAIGTNGRCMTLQEADDTVSPHIAGRRAFLQAYLESDIDRPFDVRVYIVDGRILGAMKRYAPASDWRTNVAVGGNVEDFSEALPSAAADLAARATAVLGLDYAGVDLLRHDGNWYVLEVNATAGFRGFHEATGTSPAPYIAKLAIEHAGGTVDDDQVAVLAETLDDSDPPGRLSAANDPDLQTVGYTERVAVGGQHGVEEVVAKSDTGARRISIDTTLAADIGAGPIVDTARVKTPSGTESTRRPLVELEVQLAGRWHSTTASVEDRSHLRYPLLLGRDILEGTHVDITKRVRTEE